MDNNINNTEEFESGMIKDTLFMLGSIPMVYIIIVAIASFAN